MCTFLVKEGGKEISVVLFIEEVIGEAENVENCALEYVVCNQHLQV